MPADPNAGLIKAIEGLSRALSDNTKAGKELTKEIKSRLPRTMTFVNHPYLKEQEEGAQDGAEPTGDSSGR